jgi:hypothetical protein
LTAPSVCCPSTKNIRIRDATSNHAEPIAQPFYVTIKALLLQQNQKRRGENFHNFPGSYPKSQEGKLSKTPKMKQLF